MYCNTYESMLYLYQVKQRDATNKHRRWIQNYNVRKKPNEANLSLMKKLNIKLRLHTKMDLKTITEKE